MRIACPHCGDRGLDEFVFLGDASVTRPTADAAEPADAFHAYGYLRTNPAGPTDELWFHASGCHAWLVVTRDTRTHVISAVRLAQEVALERRSVASTTEDARA